MDKKNLLVAFGGASPEHEVSVLTAHQAMAALEDSEYNLVPLYITKNGRFYTGNELLELKEFEDLKALEQKLTPCGFMQNEYGQPVLRTSPSGIFKKQKTIPVYAALIAFHGSRGENGSFQGLCEMYTIPYTGSGVAGSAIGMDKVAAKNLCRANGIPVVESVDFYESGWVDRRDKILSEIEALDYPVIVKPVHLGSSIGVKVVHSRDELIRAVEEAFRYDDHLLLETVVSPLMEINCSVLGSSETCRTSVCERPLGREEILSFQDKYMNDEEVKGMASADREIPAKISDDLENSIREASEAIFTMLNCSGVARLDFLVNSDTGVFYFNEINTIPGSFSFYLWEETGLSFPDLTKELIEIAVEEQKRKSRRIQSYETNLLSRKAVKGIKGLKQGK
jgi:D-alanine-D-alanine ligase